jgi:hypothetical protein
MKVTTTTMSLLLLGRAASLRTIAPARIVRVATLATAARARGSGVSAFTWHKPITRKFGAARAAGVALLMSGGGAALHTAPATAEAPSANPLLHQAKLPKFESITPDTVKPAISHLVSQLRADFSAFEVRGGYDLYGCTQSKLVTLQ